MERTVNLTDDEVTNILGRCRNLAMTKKEIPSFKHIFIIYLADKDSSLHQIFIEQKVDLLRLVGEILNINERENTEQGMNANFGVLFKLMQKFSSEEGYLSVSLLFIKAFNDLYKNNKFTDDGMEEARLIKDLLDKQNITDEKIDEIVTSNMKESVKGVPKSEAKAIKREVTRRQSFLTSKGIDLTKKAKENDNFGKIFGRKSEIEDIIYGLSKMKGNNVLLIGHPGVGKTELVNALAAKIVKGNVPDHLQNYRLMELHSNKIIAGASIGGELENRVDSIVKELSESDDLILFLDEIHQIMNIGSNLPNAIKPILETGGPIIGATTFDEYNQLLKKDRALTRRFVSIKVDEMPEEQLLQVVNTVLPIYEEFHKVNLQKRHLRQIMEIAKKYFPDVYAPANVISVLDTLFAMEKCNPPEEIVQASQLNAEINKLLKEIENIDSQEEPDYEQKAKLSTKMMQAKEQVKELDIGDGTIEADPEGAVQVVSRITGIPESSVGSALIEKLPRLKPYLKESISGQDEIIEEVSNSIIRACLDINFGDGPKNVMMFLGPTGVGKTYMCQKLNEFLFGSREKMLRLDMSEFHGRHSINRLIGSAPGYVGYDEGGRLTNFVSDHPHGLVLLDEIEKAHPDVLHAFLQVFDAGRLTDGRGREINFKHSIIIMTSNIGSEAILKDVKDLGFTGVLGSEEDRDKRNKEKVFKVLEEESNGFTPEFLNRISDKIVFKVLSEESILNIVSNQVEEVVAKIAKHGVKVSVSKAALKFISKKGYDKKYGARNVSRTIIDLLSNPVSNSIAMGVYRSGDKIKVGANKEELTFNKDE